jgi:hypothetical protein
LLPFDDLEQGVSCGLPRVWHAANIQDSCINMQ